MKRLASGAERRKIPQRHAELTFDSPTKALSLPQTTCHHSYIAHTLRNVTIHSSQKRRHWLHYPAPSLGYPRVPECTDANRERRQYREGHLAVGLTIQALNFSISLKEVSHVQAVVSLEFVQLRYDDQRAYG